MMPCAKRHLQFLRRGALPPPAGFIHDYLKQEGKRATQLPDRLNFKAYWGGEPGITIVHFHGATWHCKFHGTVLPVRPPAATGGSTPCLGCTACACSARPAPARIHTLLAAAAGPKPRRCTPCFLEHRAVRGAATAGARVGGWCCWAPMRREQLGPSALQAVS